MADLSLNVFLALYSGNEGFSSIGGLIVWLFSVTCGVLQGCPFSGSLFVIAIDPLLHLFEKYIQSPGLGRIYACADDLGAAVTSVRALITVFHLFVRMTEASGLTLKPSKCVLIPLAFELTPENVATLRGWLGTHIPAWRDMQICSKGKYLGLFLGPGVSPSTNWNGACCKFVDRVSQLSDQRWPLEVRARQLASKAVSILSYIAQLQDPPPKFKSLELRMASKALGLATSAFCTNSVLPSGNSEDHN